MHKQLSLLTLLAVFFCTFSSAQHPNQFVKSGEILKQAYQYADSNWYDKAIDTLKTVDKSDTAYTLVLTEMAYNYMKAKKYAEAIQTVNLAQSFTSPYKHRLILIKGNAYDNWGYPDSAISVYKRSLAKFPYSYLIYYNMGIAYMNQNKFEESVKAFQQSITYNPFHTSSHIALGRIMARMGQYAHAMLCLETYLIIEPNASRSNYNLVFINNMVSNAMDKEYTPISPVIDNKAFEEIDQLIKSGIALSSGYKAKVKFDAPVAKQTQVLFESLQYKPNTGDFWMDKYVPMFLKAKEAGHMEDFIYTIVTSAPNKDVASQLKKREKAIKEMNSILGTSIATFHQNLEININGTKEKFDFYLNDNNNILSFGKYNTDHKRIGYWKFFHNNGEADEEGYYSNGKLDGKWAVYNDDGSISLHKNFSNGELQGDYYGYYNSGNLKFKATYLHDNLQGDVTYYYDCNAISSILHFDNGKKNGKQKTFYKNGAISEEYFCVNDSLEGENKTFYANGSLKSIYIYNNNKIQGRGIDYYLNKKPSYRGEYTNSVRNGAYTTFHQNGITHISGTYKNGKQIGEWKEFDDHGKLTKLTYYNDKGNIDKENKTWDNDGKLANIFTYNNDVLKEIKYVDKNGKIIGNTKLTSKSTQVKGYYADGNLLYEGPYTNGKPDGTWTYYYKCGKKSTIKNFKDGVLNGPFTSFFSSGIKMSEADYTDGKNNGHYTSYYPNGHLQTAGYYVDDNQEGKWHYWYSDGKLEKTFYFLNGEANGFIDNYAPDEKLQYRTGYKNGTIISIADFDTLGHQMSHTLLDGKSDYCLHYLDGKIRSKGDFKCNQFNGLYTFYDRNGNPDGNYKYCNGEKEGPYTNYYSPGKIKLEGFYEANNQSGLWKYYDKDGNLTKKGYFLDDKKDSLWTEYHINGKVRYEIKFKNDEMIDTVKNFDPLGEFMFSLVYDDYGLVSYQYLGPDGNVSKVINPKDSGIITTYYKNGKKSSEQSYKYSVIQGKQVFYYSNGNIYREFSLVGDNLMDGKFTEYFENGKMKAIENFQFGLYHGTNQYFIQDGTLERSEEYRYDDEHGSFVNYDAQGKKIKETKYWGSILLN